MRTTIPTVLTLLTTAQLAESGLTGQHPTFVLDIRFRSGFAPTVGATAPGYIGTHVLDKSLASLRAPASGSVQLSYSLGEIKVLSVTDGVPEEFVRLVQDQLRSDMTVVLGVLEVTLQTLPQVNEFRAQIVEFMLDTVRAQVARQESDLDEMVWKVKVHCAHCHPNPSLLFGLVDQVFGSRRGSQQKVRQAFVGIDAHSPFAGLATRVINIAFDRIVQEERERVQKQVLDDNLVYLQRELADKFRLDLDVRPWADPEDYSAAPPSADNATNTQPETGASFDETLQANVGQDVPTPTPEPVAIVAAETVESGAADQPALALEQDASQPQELSPAETDIEPVDLQPTTGQEPAHA